MKIEDYMLYLVECYVNNEIEYELQDEDTLKYLESLDINDLVKISELVFDEELQNKIYDNINYYLYHYKKEKECE